MKLRWLVVLGILLMGLLILGQGCEQTKYVCSDGSIVTSSNLCSNKVETNINSQEQTKEQIQAPPFYVSLDYMGAIGIESTGFGDGWIDAQDCQNSDLAVKNNYENCKLNLVQILTGSDPNPLKAHSGNIFGNGEVFKARCICYQK